MFILCSPISLKKLTYFLAESKIIFIDNISDVKCDYTGSVNYIIYLDKKNNMKDAWESSNNDTESKEISEIKEEKFEKSL